MNKGRLVKRHSFKRSKNKGGSKLMGAKLTRVFNNPKADTFRFPYFPIACTSKIGSINIIEPLLLLL